MTEELQHLIDKIQSEAIDTADRRAMEIEAEAREKAASVLQQADDRAREIVEMAEQEAVAFTERSKKTLEQSARDLLITVGKGVEQIITGIVAGDVKEALTPDLLAQMLLKIAESFADRKDEADLKVLLNPEDKAKVLEYFKARSVEKLINGTELLTDSEIFKGFKISFADRHVYHEFTDEAIAEAVGSFLRPNLAEIVHRVARSGNGDTA